MAGPLPVAPPPGREPFSLAGAIAPAWLSWFNQVWRAVRYDNLVDAANDTAAATAGVGIGQLYRTGSILKVRVS